MEKVRQWCGQSSDRGQLKNRTEQTRTPLLNYLVVEESESDAVDDQHEDDGESESEARGRRGRVAVAARVDPERGPRQGDEQERGRVDLGREEVHVGTERRRETRA